MAARITTNGLMALVTNADNAVVTTAGLMVLVSGEIDFTWENGAMISEVFPERMSFGTNMGDLLPVDVTTADSGAEQRNDPWDDLRGVYDVARNVDTAQRLNELRAFHRIARGQTFRFKDWLDYSTADYSGQDIGTATKDDMNIGTGNGVLTDFQMTRTYTFGALTYTRNVVLPKNGTVLVAVAGTLKTEGVDYTVDYDTGIVTFGAAPASGAITWGGQFYKKCRFDLGGNPLSVRLTDYWAGTAEVRIVEVINE